VFSTYRRVPVIILTTKENRVTFTNMILIYFAKLYKIFNLKLAHLHGEIKKVFLITRAQKYIDSQ
jgi:hypothetical protein